MTPIKLFYNARPQNFGDHISADLVQFAAQRPVTWTRLEDAELFAVGSIIGFAQDRLEKGPESWPYLWGSGLMMANGKWLFKAARLERVSAVRGPFTAHYFRGFRGAMGDPALLCPRLVPAPAERGDTVLVPHHEQYKKQPEFIERAVATGLRIVDVRQADPWNAVREIASASAVLSVSLHGLIVADAYRVPSIWVSDEVWLNGSGSFKFFDHFASIGRIEPGPLPLEDAVEAAARGAFNTRHLENIDRVADRVLAAFPPALRAEAAALETSNASLSE
ncbi:MAG: polysaccharide pyruvyl transferase family protein [Pseudomonadota bacterium]